MVKVIITRHCLPGREEELEGLLGLLRSKATPQPGYILGETLRSLEDPGLFVVVSTWFSVDQWRSWEGSQERRETSALVARLLRIPEETTVYDQVWVAEWSEADVEGARPLAVE